jgi:trehalose 6-phosphate synthase
MELQRESITIRTFLWTFHYLHDTATVPAFGDDITEGWAAYDEVNRAFANALAAAHRNEDDEVVLVNDFHLMLVPAFFSTAVRHRASRLAYFHHVPWCEPEYFGILPRWMLTRVLESLLNCDVVGFHCDRWGDAFLACCDRFLAGVKIAQRTVIYRDHQTLVTTAPGPIDAHVLEELNLDPSTEQWRETLRARAGGRRIVTRVDRLDLWKNLVRGFAAYDALLRRRPELASEIWFCAVVTPPRLQTDRHRQYQVLCDDVVQRINERYAAGREAVSLVYPEGTNSQRNRAVAALSLGSVTLVNPTFDGLNMVAKEAAVVNPRAHLLLSTNAGAYARMASMVVPIQPFDVASTADALEYAVDKEERDDEVDSDKVALRIESAVGWLRTVLGSPVR